MLKNLLKTSTDPLVTPERMGEPPSAVLRRPALRISETDTGYQLVADMPGVTADLLTISIEGGTLTLRGTAPAMGPDQGEPVWREYEPGTFERTLELPAGIATDGITATTSNGQVRMSLPKEKAVQPRRIPVTSA